MSTFTMSLKKVFELTGGTVDYAEDGTPTYSNLHIGLEGYPIFDEGYRTGLNAKILDHYWNREIGTESVDMFKLAMRRKMNEIMPYLNQLYTSTQLEFDPLSTIDIHTVTADTTEVVASGTTTSESVNESTGGSRSVTSETPQTMLAGNKDYASAAADVNSSSNTEANSSDATSQNSNTENAGDSRVTGYQGIPSDLLMAYRASLINVDMMVITQLEELFMLVWDNGDTYASRGYIL